MRVFLDHTWKSTAANEQWRSLFLWYQTYYDVPLLHAAEGRNFKMEEVIDTAMKYTNFNDIPLLLSVEQLTEVLGIGRNTAYQLVRSEKIKCIRIGRIIKIPRENIKEFFM